MALAEITSPPARQNCREPAFLYRALPCTEQLAAAAQTPLGATVHRIFLLPHETFQAASALPPPLRIFTRLLNPRGISYFPCSENALVWHCPPQAAHLLAEHFPETPFEIPAAAPADISGSLNPHNAAAHGKTLPPWFRLPEKGETVQNACVIGGGIAGAATARALAARNIRVTLLEKNRIARAASGNYQGLLYAKISPHDTMQSRLLLHAYAYAQGVVRQMLPEKNGWDDCGILHLDFDDKETRRHAALAAQNSTLYRAVGAAEASRLAGVPLAAGGLFWQNGIWLHPPALVKRLSEHENIALHENCAAQNFRHDGSRWQIFCADGRQFSADALIVCSGAHLDFARALGIHLAQIRGQTEVLPEAYFSGSLKTAVSGAGYISPPWQGKRCFGASFRPNCADDAVSAADFAENAALLQKTLGAHSLRSAVPPGRSLSHAAVRCDAFDHLPVVGRVGSAAAMRRIYAKLAQDKNYRIDEDCPYPPHLYLNTAHGSRGLLTAPLAAWAVAAEICGTPHPLDNALRAALSPNRLIIRDIVRRKNQTFSEKPLFNIKETS